MNIRTGNARTTAASPPRWSSCRWVSSIRSITATPRARSAALSAGPASRGPPSIRTILPVGDVTSAASPWPTAMKSTRSGAGAGAGGAAYAAVPVASATARRNPARRRRSSGPTAPGYGHGTGEHKKTERPHAAVSAARAKRCVVGLLFVTQAAATGRDHPRDHAQKQRVPNQGGTHHAFRGYANGVW